MHVCVFCSCPQESKVRVCPVTTNTVSLCAQRLTACCSSEPRECQTWAALALLIYRFKSLACRGCPPTGTRSRTHPRAGCTGRVVGRMFNLSFHHKFQLLFSSFKDHGTQYGLKCFFSDPASREKANVYGAFYFCRSWKTRQSFFFFFICMDESATILFLLLVL